MTGPKRFAFGPDDYEGLGRERWHDMTPEQRDEARAQMCAMAHPRKAMGGTKPGPVGQPSFAKGWLAEDWTHRAAATK